MRVDIHAQQACSVGTNPNVATAVASHTVDRMVHADTRQSQLIAHVGVPLVGVLVIHHQRALTVEPDIVHLVGKDTQRLTASQTILGNVIGLPYGMLLMHDVAAYQSSVFIHQECTVATLADRNDVSLRNTYGIIGIAKLIVGLLLLVISHHTLVGYRGPEVLMAVYINHVGLSLYTHAGIYLLHVALKVLRLWVVDTKTCRSFNPQRTFQRFLYTDDVAVGQRRTVLRITLEVTERIAVVAVQTCCGAKP